VHTPQRFIVGDRRTIIGELDERQRATEHEPSGGDAPARSVRAGRDPAFSGRPPDSLNFVYSFSGSLDGILVATGSVDQTGNYVFAVEPHGVGQHGGVSSVYWAYGGGLDTMYTVWNALSIVQQVQLLLVGDNGVLLCSIPIRLAPGASQTVDIFELVMSGAPDSAGRIMPRGSMQGSALLTGPKNDTTERMTVVIAGGIYNSKTATCGTTCETCLGSTTVSASPDPVSIAVTGTAQMSDEFTWYTGYQYTYTGSTQWSSSATSVATIQTKGQSSPGLATGVGDGSLEFEANFGVLPECAGQICVQGTLPACPTYSPVAYAPATTCPLTVTLDATTNLPLQAGLTNNFPTYLTGFGLIATMFVGPGPYTWNGYQITEALTTTSNSCPIMSFPAPCTGTSTFTVGPPGLGGYALWDGNPHRAQQPISRHTCDGKFDLPNSPSSCTTVCAQTYSACGRTIGNFTITRNYTQSTINGTAVTLVGVTKQ
jgi:hypothetical protein